MNATSLLVYPGPTATHRHPSIASREDERYGTLLGLAQTSEIASRAALDFLTSKPVAFEDVTTHPMVSEDE